MSRWRDKRSVQVQSDNFVEAKMGLVCGKIWSKRCDSSKTIFLFLAGVLKERMEAGLEELKECRACPRDCGVDRLSDKMGACNTGRKAIVR